MAKTRPLFSIRSKCGLASRAVRLMVLRGEGKVVLPRGKGLGAIIRVSSADTGGSVSVVEHTLEPGFLGAPPHRHQREDETSYVLEGALTVQIGDEIATVQAGSIIVKPRGIFHTFWNSGTQPLRFLEIISPGGFEHYFEELARLFAGGPPDMREVSAVAERYGLEFDVSRLPEVMQKYGVRLT